MPWPGLADHTGPSAPETHVTSPLRLCRHPGDKSYGGLQKTFSFLRGPAHPLFQEFPTSGGHGEHKTRCGPWRQLRPKRRKKIEAKEGMCVWQGRATGSGRQGGDERERGSIRRKHPRGRKKGVKWEQENNPSSFLNTYYILMCHVWGYAILHALSHLTITSLYVARTMVIPI